MQKSESWRVVVGTDDQDTTSVLAIAICLSALVPISWMLNVNSISTLFLQYFMSTLTLLFLPMVTYLLATLTLFIFIPFAAKRGCIRLKSDLLELVLFLFILLCLMILLLHHFTLSFRQF